MISRGGVFDKLGNWYEEAAVVLQCLRILLDEAQSVQWEPPQDEGIDYIIYEQGKRIAVQCKTRSSGSWSPSDLEKPLAYARARLDDGANEYRFVTDQKPTSLVSAVADAHGDVSAWLAQDEKNRRSFVQHLGCADDWELALGYLKRIDVRITSQAELQDRIWELAKTLAGEQREALLLRLITVVKRQESLGITWTATTLRDAVTAWLNEPSLSWNGLGTHGTSAVWLEERTSEFLARIAAARRERSRYPRDATAAVLASCQRDQHAGVILVHGAAGCGKSEVIAQVVEGLRERRMPVLALRADAPGDSAVGADPIRRFCGLLGDTSGCLVIDQLDQVASVAGGAYIPHLVRWVQTAIKAGLIVVAGCRSVDALQDTQLHQILHHLGRPPEMIPVEDLPESAVIAQLSPVGIPLDDLGTDLKRLVRNPMMLGLLLDLVSKRGSWRGAASTYDLIDQWCQVISRDHGPDAVRVLDAITELMAKDNVIAVDVTLLDPTLRSTALRLQEAGILLPEGDGSRVRIFHQTIADACLARRWSQVSSGAELMGIIGPMADQAFCEARRLRLCIPRFAARGATGVSIIGHCAFHEQMRPLLHRALLMGLADVSNVSPQLRNLVINWLADAERREVVLRTTIWNQVAWWDVLEVEWLDEAWTTWPDAQRDWLLDFCASVSIRRGDAVARHLATWERQHPGTLARARSVFWHEPSQDSDTLFQMRLEWMARSVAGQDYPPSWPKLIDRHPQRAIALLRTLLETLSDDALTSFNPPHWLHEWPSSLPDSLRLVSCQEWLTLFPWWRTIGIECLGQISFRYDNLPDGVLAVVAENLAQGLASALSWQELTWNDLLAQVPNPMRDLDGWLLLRIGHHLNSAVASETACRAAVEWFMSDPRWAHLSIGLSGSRYRLVQEFLRSVSAGLSPESFAILECWLVQYRDAWTVSDERYRNEWIERGAWFPNDRGKTAYFLLPALDRSRWSLETTAYFNSLDQKFSSYASVFDLDRSGSGGSVVYVVPQVVTDRWSDQQWMQQLRTAPGWDRQWKQLDTDTVGSSDIQSLNAQLSGSAERNPQRFVSLAHAIADSDPPFADSTYAMLIGTLVRSGVQNQSPGPRLDDAVIAELVEHPAYLMRDACAREVVSAVEGRAAFPWPPTIIERLRVIATGDGKDIPDRPDGLISYRINDAACTALHALAAVARYQPARQADLLQLAESLCSHPNRGRRASVVVLAKACRDADLLRAASLTLNVIGTDPLIAAEYDIHPWLRWLAGSPAVDDAIRDKAKTALLHLVEYDEHAQVAQWGGIGALCLRARERIDHAALVSVLGNHAVARTAVARQVSLWLQNRDASEWLRNYAIDLANDDHAAVGDAVMRIFSVQNANYLLDDTNFVTAMIDSAAGRRDPDDLIRACDRRGSLLSVSHVILRMAEARITGDVVQGNAWKFAYQHGQICGLLTRLYEDASRNGHTVIARQALDALDRVIDSGRLPTMDILTLITRQDA